MAKMGETAKGKDLRKEGKKWLDRIKQSQANEKHWIDNADVAVKIYGGDGAGSYDGESSLDTSFNILYANVETIVPAIINSPPVPDIRRRFGEKDEAARDVAEMLERSISIQVDDSRLQTEMEGMSQDAFLAGRGIIRLRYMSEVVEAELESIEDEALDDAEIDRSESDEKYEGLEGDGYSSQDNAGEVLNERIEFEAISWRDYAHGPAKRWPDRNWDAYRHAMPVEDVETFQDQAMVTSQTSSDDKQSTGETDTDLIIWEVWCKKSKKVKFISENSGTILKILDDPLGLTQFFPIADPVQPVEITNRLMPINPYSVYRELAKELDTISKRIIIIAKAMQVKGWYPGSSSDLENLVALGDNEFAPITDGEIWAQHGGLANAVAFWPAEKYVLVLQQLYVSRTETKQAIYEITGISDIVRGASKASETLGAQQIKSQWGSLRIQKAQRSMERAARDLFVMMSEIIPTKFSIETLEKMTGIKLQPSPEEMQPIPMPDMLSLPEEQQQQAMVQYQTAQQEHQKVLAKYQRIAELMKYKASSYYAINVETQSTTRADLTQQKAEVSQFLTASAQYFQAVAPMVSSGDMPPTVAIEVYAANSRLFNLGRSTEAAIDEMVDMATEKAKQPPPEPQPNPEMIKIEQDKIYKDADIDLRNKEFDLKSKEAIQRASIDQLKIKTESDINAIKDQLEVMLGRLDVQKAQLEVEGKRLDVEGKELENTSKEVDLINTAAGDTSGNV